MGRSRNGLLIGDEGLMNKSRSEQTERGSDNGARAAAMAAKMPLVHYPAHNRFEDWADGSQGWSGLRSHDARGAEYDEGSAFGRLRGQHVFFYAGPSCYYRRECVGNALLYFAPRCERGHTGSASPFDSGSLEPASAGDPRPRLQPWRARGASSDECWAFFEQHRVPLDGWRERFAEWLSSSYDDPDRYLETELDRFAAGEPDRLTPAELLVHNGTRGRARYGDDCGDRRTWTWEVRIEGEVAWDAVAAVHVPFDLMRVAAEWAEHVEARHKTLPEVFTLARDAIVDFDGLYEASSATLREMVGE